VTGTGRGTARSWPRRAAYAVVLLSLSIACGSGTAPGELKLLVSGVLTSAVNGEPLRWGGVTLYELDPGSGTRTPIAAVVVNMNGSYVLTVNESGCDETRLELEANALGYSSVVYDAASQHHVRCVSEPQAIDFQLSATTVP